MTSVREVAMGGPSAERKFEYDARSNITRLVSDGTDYDYTLNTELAHCRDWVSSFGADSWNKVDITHDFDGRVVMMDSPPMMSSSSTSRWTLEYVGTSGITAGTETVMRGVAFTTGSITLGYNYYYDHLSRRVFAQGPVSESYFLYDLGHQLLETFSAEPPPDPFEWPLPDPWRVAEEFIWLNGRPIAGIRSRIQGEEAEDPQIVHVGDEFGDCSRGGDGVACGIYFIVTDHIGKPVLTVDIEGRVSGVGEYDPRGTVNRVAMNAQSDHPYGYEDAGQPFTATQRTLGGMPVRFRFHFPIIDTEIDCYGTPSPNDHLFTFSDPYQPVEHLGFYSRGETWSAWLNGHVDGNQATAGVFWWPNENLNCSPSDCEASCEDPSMQYTGFVLREYEYQRTESGASPYFPNFRYPGHYWDPETDLQENWHRYFSPLLDQYLSPEPMLQDPRHTLGAARRGSSAPTYAYAPNNPTKETDPTGKFPTVCLAEAFANFRLADLKPGTCDKILHCTASCELAKACGVGDADLVGNYKEIYDEVFKFWILKKGQGSNYRDMEANRRGQTLSAAAQNSPQWLTPVCDSSWLRANTCASLCAKDEVIKAMVCE